MLIAVRVWLARPGRVRALVRALVVVCITGLVFAQLMARAPPAGAGLEDVLRGPDDFTRLVQVRDWLGGQGWRDLVPRRLDLGDGVALHWSRVADLPVAGLVWLLEPALGRDAAFDAAVRYAPALLGAAFVLVFTAAAIGFSPAPYAKLPLLMAPLAIVVYPSFWPGRIDHHGLQHVLVAAALALLARALRPAAPVAPALALGLVCALSLAVSLETVPIIAAVTGAMGAAYVLRGAAAARALVVFRLAFALCACVFIGAFAPLGAWLEPVCDRLSLVHVAWGAGGLAAGVAGVAFGRLCPGASPCVRLLVAGGAGAAVFAAAFAATAECVGVLAVTAPEVRWWHDQVSEVQSLGSVAWSDPGVALGYVLVPIAALVLIVRDWLGGSRSFDVPLVALAGLVAAMLVLVLWQTRAVPYVSMVGVLALVPYAVRLELRAARLAPGPRRIGLVVAVPLACVLASAAPGYFGAWVTPSRPPLPCPVSSIVPILTSDPRFAGRSVVIAAPIDAGPVLLALTPHRVFAAPYHRNLTGLRDHRALFGGSERSALSVLARRGVDAVVFCRAFRAATSSGGVAGFLATRLDARRPPVWLEALEVTDLIGLYAVLPRALADRIAVLSDLPLARGAKGPR